MNYDEALSVKDLAPGVNKVMKGLDIGKCPHCKEGLDPICRLCNSTGKVKWKWQPKIGECFYGLSKKLHWIVNEKQRIQLTTQLIKDNYITFILSWETIEGILEKVGYKLKIRKTSEGEYFALIKEQTEVGGIGESRQEAVMKAVLRLGEELRKCGE